MSDQFQQAFEAYVPWALQAAYEYVDFDPRVETIWIAGFRDGDWGLADIFYRVGDQVGTPGRMKGLLPELDDSVQHQDDLDETVLGLSRGLLLDVEPHDENPTRVVIRYDVASQSMDADFSYEPLKMGRDDTLSDVADAWLERLRTSGDDSASN